MTNKIIRLGLLFTIFSSLLFSTLNSHAQTIFDVELVFFKRLDAGGHFNYLAKEERLNLERNYSLVSPANLPQGYQLLNRTDRKLEGVFRKLRSSANMRPLLHLGWRQTLNDKEASPWLSFNVSDDPLKKGLQQFAGNIRFSRNQGLLVENRISGFKTVDLGLVNNPSLATEATQDDATEVAVDEQIPEQLTGYFVLEESRKIKINKLHYFDHPAMGVLIKISPYQATVEEQEALE